MPAPTTTTSAPVRTGPSCQLLPATVAAVIHAVIRPARSSQIEVLGAAGREPSSLWAISSSSSATVISMRHGADGPLRCRCDRTCPRPACAQPRRPRPPTAVDPRGPADGRAVAPDGRPAGPVRAGDVHRTVEPDGRLPTVGSDRRAARPDCGPGDADARHHPPRRERRLLAAGTGDPSRPADLVPPGG